jgi:hypothetical protein
MMIINTGDVPAPTEKFPAEQRARKALPDDYCGAAQERTPSDLPTLVNAATA